jgi:Rrf2 family protein
MLTKTSETALQALALIAAGDDAPLTPKYIAEQLGASPSYMAKISGGLVKAGILHAQRGTHGGVTLARSPEAITLLEVVEACQGRILGDYCMEADTPELVCAFHQAMLELHEAVVNTLQRWTLAEILEKPLPDAPLLGQVPCKMGCLHGALARQG